MGNSIFSEWKKNKQFHKAEFNRRYGRYYIVYIALIGTGVLSGLTGILLPFSQGMNNVEFIVSVLAGLYFCVGFLTNGEIAANYWFGKLTDHDPDSRVQQIIAGISLALSVIVSLVTSLASSLLIAYWLGIFPEFGGVPDWAQVWIVDIIPVMWIYNGVCGMAFKATSEEAQAERLVAAFVREKQNELFEAKEQAKVDFWRDNARPIYEEAGRKEAADDVERRFKGVHQFAAKVDTPEAPRQSNPTPGAERK